MRSLITGVILVLSAISGHACDACGCSINGDGWGIMPNYNRHFAGIRFQYRHFHSTHPLSASDAETGSTNGTDQFYRTEIFGRLSLHKRIQIMATLPYKYNDRVEGPEHMIVHGLGDASAIIQYLPVLPGCNDWKHALQLTAGAEGPTGKFKFSHDVPSAIQTGSGTWDYLAGINYTIRYRNIGMSVEGTGRMNGNTKAGYDWGNSASTSARLFLTLHPDSVRTLIPFSGVGYEYYEPNIENMKYQIKAAYTGGQLLTWNAGIDYYSSSIGFGIEGGIPIVNELSEGNTTMRLHLGARFMMFIPSGKAQKSNLQ